MLMGRLGRRSRRLIRSIVLAALLISLLGLTFHQDRFQSKTDIAEDEIIEIEQRGMDPPPTLDTDPPIPWNSSISPHNPCYYNATSDSTVCGPALYLMGFQNAGLKVLGKAVGYHPDIDCYSTGFFAGFDDLLDITSSDMEQTYFSSFSVSTQQIVNETNENADKLCICDAGHDLDRPYANPPPLFTTSDALKVMYDDIKVLVIMSDPTRRFVREYCALGLANSTFATYVNTSIEAFLDCEANAAFISSCVYNESLSGLLQAGLYDFHVNGDVNITLDADDYKLICFNQLQDVSSRNQTMTDILHFLEKDIPEDGDIYWDLLPPLFAAETSYCTLQSFPPDAIQALDEFYSTRATIYFDLCEEFETTTAPPTTGDPTAPPTTAKSTKPPTTAKSTKPPTTAKSTKPPTTAKSTKPPTTSKSTKPPTTSKSTKPPTTSESTKPPTTSQSTKPPTTSQSTKPPTTSQSTKPPTTSESTKPPTTSESTKPPTTSESTKPPTTAESTKPPTTAESTKPPTTAESTKPPTTAESTKPPTTAKSTKPPTTAKSTKPPTTAKSTKPPTTAKSTKPPSP